MIGIIVQLAISWGLIWLIEKKDLSVLGLWPNKRRLTDFAALFIVTAVFCSLGFVLKMYFGNQQWQLNPQLSLKLVSNGIWWNIKSVLFEELIFRGAMLYLLFNKIGATKGILLSAAGFGVYHWFSLGVFGNPMAMVMIFIITGTMGLLLAYGFTKSLSMYTPIGIHLGWNLTQILVFSQGPIGNGIFVQTSAEAFRTDSYLIFFVVTFLPIILALTVNYLIIRKHNSDLSGFGTLIQGNTNNLNRVPPLTPTVSCQGGCV